MTTTQEIIAPATADMRLMRMLAREIALDMHPLPDILKHYGVSIQQFEEIRTNDRFKTILREAMDHWNSALTTRERVELKAQALIESQLEEACAFMNDKQEPASARVEMFKAVARVAKIGEKDLVSEAGQKVAITINMGADKVTVEQDVTPRGNVIEGELVDG